MIEYVPSKCFITRFRAAVIVLVGPRCPALLKLYRCKCAHSLLGKSNSDRMNKSMVIISSEIRLQIVQIDTSRPLTRYFFQ